MGFPNITKQKQKIFLDTNIRSGDDRVHAKTKHKEYLMINFQHMQRQFTAGRYDQLLKSILDNGLQLPNELAAHLQDHPVCVTALALKRALEVSYGCSDTLIGPMVDFLLQAQEADGSLGFAPLPTACAMIALRAVLDQAPQGSRPVTRPQAIARAHDAARKALEGMLAEEAVNGLATAAPGQLPLLAGSQALDWAFVLQLIWDDTTWHNHQPACQLHRWFARYQQQLPADVARLWRRAGYTAPIAAPDRVQSVPESTDYRSMGANVSKSYPGRAAHGRFRQSPRGSLRGKPDAKHAHAA